MAKGKKGKDGKSGKKGGKGSKDGKKDGDGGQAGGEGSPNESDGVATAAAQAHLRDASPEEKEAWGRINDRDVSRSLKELWDKIPGSYRLTVIEYFRDITAPEEEEPAKE